MAGKADGSTLSLFGRGRIFSIPASAPFLETLARAILRGHLAAGGAPGPLELADLRIYLPNRVACRGLEAALLRACEDETALLPRIRSMGEDEDDALLILPTAGSDDPAPSASIPAAIGALERRMVLARLILAWAERLKHGADDLGALGLSVANTPASASELALGLMRLMDEAEAQEVDLSRLRSLLPERFAAHEQLSLGFLDIVMSAWPAYLAASGRLSPMERHNRMLTLETEAIAELDADRHVIVAGSFGAMPATEALIGAAYTYPCGSIVLPGVDFSLDEAAWQTLTAHPEHPQAAAARLLGRLGASRTDINVLPVGSSAESPLTHPPLAGALSREGRGPSPADERNGPSHKHGIALSPRGRGRRGEAEPGEAAFSHRRPAAELSFAAAARQRFISEAMRPSSTVAAWPDYIAKTQADSIRAALAGVSLVTAPTMHEEAAAIALILREAIETPGHTASLITPDRGLARRVCAQLGKWGLALPDAAGAPLSRTLPGVFHQLIAEAAASGSRIALLSLLKHPLTRLGLPPGAVEASAPIIEIAAIRQPWAGDGASQLTRSLSFAREQYRKPAALNRLADADWNAAEAVATRFAQALQPLAALAGLKPGSLQTLAEAHRAAAGRLSIDEIGEPPMPDAAGEAMNTFMAALASELPGPLIALKDYPALLRSLLSLEVCRGAEAGHPRLSILGPREARLTLADTVIIAGLNEGTWPGGGEASPWLNRTMRKALGLPPAERETAFSAHDFAQAMGAPEVILTRALKVDGTPTVPSRWLLRLEALLGGFGFQDALAPKRPWLEWATAVEAPQEKWRARPPAPCPPVEVRPRQLSVSEVATLMANPYAIHAKHILGLRPLDALEAAPGGLERGRVIHDTLHGFARRFPQELPKDTAGELLSIFDAHIARYADNARVAAFWRPRMERFARWFAETEPERRAGVAQVFAEVKGELNINTAGGPFTLRVTADRIDLRQDGTLAIYDYKGGNLPSEAEVTAFKVPHLPLQALIAGEGHFRGIEAHKVAKLAYISAKGGEPPGEERDIARESPVMLAKMAREGLEALLKHFDNEAAPYTAMRRGGAGERFDDYAHLARVEEWSGSGSSEEG